ncbi:hypothetical protein ACFL6E_05310, partial [Candidatus Neomarinimicrobiota bacterium]
LDPVFITENKSIEFTLFGYGSPGQLTYKKRINMFHGTEIGLGIGWPYLIVRGKSVLFDFEEGLVMLAADLGLIEGGRKKGLLTTLGKIGISHGKPLNNSVNRNIEFGYSWYAGYITDVVGTFPRSRTIYTIVGLEKAWGRRFTLGVFGGLTLSDLRYKMPQDGGSSIGRGDYVDLVIEKYHRTDRVYGWARQLGINAGITINYKL